MTMQKNITHLIVGAIETNCWIYSVNGNDAALIDPGGEADKIIAALKKNSLAPRYIVLTHGHFDHIAALAAIAKAFESCKPVIAIHSLDAEYLGPDSYPVHCRSITAAAGNTSFVDAFWEVPPPAAGRLLEEGDTIGPFTVLHVPGHTPGSIALWDREEGNIFTGDTLFEGTYGRTDLPGGNNKQMFESLERLLRMDSSIAVYPGHGHATTIGREKR